MLNDYSKFKESGPARINIGSEQDIVLVGTAKVTASAGKAFHVEMDVHSHIAPSGLPDYISETTPCSLLVDTPKGRMTADIRLSPYMFRSREDYRDWSRNSLKVYIDPRIAVLEPDSDSDQTGRALHIPLINLAAPFTGRDHEIIVFRYGGGVGYIVARETSAHLQRDLKQGNRKRAVTATVVLPLKNEDLDTKTLERELLFGLLPVLSLASGTEVGCPWVDLVDEKGEMVQRMFVPWRPHPYRQGHALLGTGNISAWTELLSAASESTHFGQLSLRAAIMRALRAKEKGQILEDTQGHTLRGLDNLTAVVGTNKVNVREVLGREYSPVESIRNEARGQVVALRDGDPSRSAATHTMLTSIINNTGGLLSVGRGPGHAISELVRECGFADIDIVEDFFRTIAPKRAFPWANEVSILRNQALHPGYYSHSDPGPFDGLKGRIGTHLHDLLLRVILKMLGYTGKYYCSIDRNWKNINWVTATTEVEDLGYVLESPTDIRRLLRVIEPAG